MGRTSLLTQITRSIDPEVEKQCIELNISIYNNLAACLLQLRDSKAERIKEVTEVVIELDASNEKAWFRHGQACIRLADYDKAKESFGKVAELSMWEQRSTEVDTEVRL